jgi:hypothetical protein
MIEIATFLASIWLLLAVSVLRDLWRARRDRLRAARMDQIAAQFTHRPVHEMVLAFGDPFEIAEASSGAGGRSLYIWKAPPSQGFPAGRGLLTLIVEVGSSGMVDRMEWRDRVSPLL